MPPSVASLIFVVLICWLFWADREPSLQTSKALWIPTFWLLINASRPVSEWLATFGLSGGSLPISADVYTEGSPIDRAVFTILVVTATTILVSRGSEVGSLLRRNYPVALFFGFAAFSLFWSDFPAVTLKHWIKGIGDLEMVLIIVTEADVLGATRRLLSRVGFLFVPLSVLYCKYYPAIGRLMTRSWVNTFVGVTDQKNMLGWLCLLIGLGFLWRFRDVFRDREDPRRRRRLAAYAICFAMILWLLQISDSMGSISAFIIAGMVMILSTRPMFLRNRAAVHILVASCMAIPLFALFLDSSGSLVADLGRNSTLTGRTLIWADALRMPFNRLVGAGYETFWLGERLEWMRALTQFDVNEAHNAYLEIFLNLGWIGVGLLAFLIMTGYRKVIAALRASPDEGSLYMAWFVAVLIAGLTEAAFRMMSLTCIFFFLSIMAASKASIQDDLFDVAPLYDSLDDYKPQEPQIDHVFGSASSGTFEAIR